MSLQRYELPAEHLRWDCDAGSFAFRSTAEIPPLKGIVEQERPVRAIRFGLDITSPGYNIYVSGLTGTGKTTVIKSYLDEIAAGMPTPNDWCYVFNFKDPNCPIALSLPPGKGKVLKSGMAELVRHLKTEIPKAFESKEYEQSMNQLISENQENQQALFVGLSGTAQAEGFAIEVTKVGVSLVPLGDGRAMTPEEFQALPEGTRREIDRKRSALQQDVNAFLRQVREVNKTSRDRVADLNRRVGLYVVGTHIDEIREQFREFPRLLSYLDDVQDYVVSHMEDFSDDSAKPDTPPSPKTESPQDPHSRYLVNVVVDNTGSVGAPVIIETNPTYYSVFGRMERRPHYGTLLTDFTMIRSGSLLRANGGYLVVNAHDVLMNFGTWETLKRTIKNREVRIEDLGEDYGLVPVAGMRPTPIPVDVKVIMIGNQSVYHLLYGMDEDFRKIFKVKADFDAEMNRDEKGLSDYASFIASRCHDEGLMHFGPGAVGAVAEYGARLVDDQERLSARFSDVADIVREASYWARKDGVPLVSEAHVQRAVDEKYYRSNLVECKIREFVSDGTVRVDVTGAEVGQVNGLAVIDLGDIRFGRPSRITAKTFLGKGGVVDIERESKMSGKIYEKGVLILSGFLGARFASEQPLSLSASICFEQSYEGIDGDSASSTELYALLSSLSELPIRQGIAVTGSVDQHGRVQPIGGVNQKIEGFFDVCREKGLTGEQGVMIPRRNARNLMLRQDVVDAVRAGRFHVYCVESIDEGIEILTGTPAGEAAETGYPAGSVNCLAAQKLKRFADAMSKMSATPAKHEEE